MKEKSLKVIFEENDESIKIIDENDKIVVEISYDAQPQDAVRAAIKCVRHFGHDIEHDCPSLFGK